MTSSKPDPAASGSAAAERERRRRAAELLGDLMPSTTTDETDEGWNEPYGNGRGGTSRDEEYLRDVPPHHG
ncbi:hypothetical protein [Aeromicrobium sp. UC242_57]|uniref:hypothetical protein n=1 Tax=Aeromicrobium sp. UC242_57 TaxID=3374624 RepID=UPI00379F4C83